MVSRVGSCATESREPSQVRKEAALSGSLPCAAGSPDLSRRREPRVRRPGRRRVHGPHLSLGLAGPLPVAGRRTRDEVARSRRASVGATAPSSVERPRAPPVGNFWPSARRSAWRVAAGGEVERDLVRSSGLWPMHHRAVVGRGRRRRGSRSQHAVGARRRRGRARRRARLDDGERRGSARASRTCGGPTSTAPRREPTPASAGASPISGRPRVDPGRRAGGRGRERRDRPVRLGVAEHEQALHPAPPGSPASQARCVRSGPWRTSRSTASTGRSGSASWSARSTSPRRCATPCATAGSATPTSSPGPAGTGKTTTARILAKALNCLNLGADGEPCGECENCVAIADGHVPRPLRARRGVEPRRRRRPRPRSSASASASARPAKRKVYLLDEVHMLTRRGVEHAAEDARGAARRTSCSCSRPRTPRRCCRRSGRAPSTSSSRCSPSSRSAGSSPTSATRGRRGRARGAGGHRPRRPAARRATRSRCSTRRSPTAPAGSTPPRSRPLLGGAPFELRMRDPRRDRRRGRRRRARRGSARCSTSGHDPRRVAEDLLRTAARRVPAHRRRRAGRASTRPRTSRRGCATLGEALGNAALVRVLETLGQAVVDMRGTDAADPRLVLEIALVRLSPSRRRRRRCRSLADRIERLEHALAGGARAGRAAPPRRAAPRRAAARRGRVRRRRAPAPARGRRRAGRRRPRRRAGGARERRSAQPRAAPRAPTARAAEAAPPRRRRRRRRRVRPRRRRSSPGPTCCPSCRWRTRSRGPGGAAARGRGRRHRVRRRAARSHRHGSRGSSATPTRSARRSSQQLGPARRGSSSTPHGAGRSRTASGRARSRLRRARRRTAEPRPPIEEPTDRAVVELDRARWTRRAGDGPAVDSVVPPRATLRRDRRRGTPPDSSRRRLDRGEAEASHRTR